MFPLTVAADIIIFCSMLVMPSAKQISRLVCMATSCKLSYTKPLHNMFHKLSSGKGSKFIQTQHMFIMKWPWLCNDSIYIISSFIEVTNIML